MFSNAYEALRTSAAWMNYSLRGKVRVSGEDAGRLLHAMTTNHIQQLKVGEGSYAFFLNDKGRILADATIFRLEDSFWLDTEAETAAKIHHLLDKYIIADDAEAVNESAVWIAIGIEGPDSTAVMEKLGVPWPNEPLGILTPDWGYVARISSTGPLGYRIWTNPEKRVELVDQLASLHIPEATGEEEQVVRIENRMPRYGEDISERYLVQETGLQNAVHATKGCYLGQEIVERVRSRGQVHRLLAALRIETRMDLPAGTKLVFNHAPAGEITSAAFSPALNEMVALGYVRTDLVDSKSSVIVAGTEPPVAARILM